MRRTSGCRFHSTPLRRLCRDEEGQMLLISAVFTLIIVMMLTVTVNLSHVTQQKIKAQNAADAAAMAAGIWQVRNLAFVQTLNNLVVYSDGLAFAGLMGAMVLNGTAHVDPTGLSILAGNVCLGFTVGGHVVSQVVLLPFRHLYANLIGPVVSNIGASEMARANGASLIFLEMYHFFDTLMRDTLYRAELLGVVMANQMLAAIQVDLDLAGPGGDDTMGSRVSGGFSGLQEGLATLLGGIKLRALNVRLIEGDLGSMGLGLTYYSPENLSVPLGTDGGDAVEADVLDFSLGPVPTYFPGGNTALQAALHHCYLLQPVQGIALTYFHGMEKAGKAINAVMETSRPMLDYLNIGDLPLPTGEQWAHPHLESSDDVMWPPDDPDADIILLPTSTWVTVVRAGEDTYGAWTGSWASTGGLGSKTADGSFGQLGAMAVSSVRVFGYPVTWFNPQPYQGWVELVPTEGSSFFGMDYDMGAMH